MARTKTTPKQTNVVKQTPKAKRQTKPGVIARREIKKYQASAKASIPFKPFAALLRQVMKEQNLHQYKLKRRTVEAVREAAEQYLVEKLKRADELRSLGRNTMLSVKFFRSAFSDQEGIEGVCYAALKAKQEASDKPPAPPPPPPSLVEYSSDDEYDEADGDEQPDDEPDDSPDSQPDESDGQAD